MHWEHSASLFFIIHSFFFHKICPHLVAEVLEYFNLIVNGFQFILWFEIIYFHQYLWGQFSLRFLLPFLHLLKWCLCIKCVWGGIIHSESAAQAKELCTHIDLSSQSCCLGVVSLVQALDWWPMKCNSSHQPLGLWHKHPVLTHPLTLSIWIVLFFLYHSTFNIYLFISNIRS